MEQRTAYVTVCNQDAIRNLCGLPDCAYCAAILTKDTYRIKVKYTDDPNTPAHMNASAACRALGCFPSDLLILEWDYELGKVFGGTPWVHDEIDSICIHVEDEDPIHIVDDFFDLC